MLILICYPGFVMAHEYQSQGHMRCQLMPIYTKSRYARGLVRVKIPTWLYKKMLHMDTSSVSGDIDQRHQLHNVRLQMYVGLTIPLEASQRYIHITAYINQRYISQDPSGFIYIPVSNV